MDNEKMKKITENKTININGHDINPTGHYFLNTVRKVLSQSDKLCARSYITYLMQIGRLDPPIYPYGRTTNKGGNLNTKDPHYWYGSAIIKAVCGENWQQEQGADNE